MPRRRSRSKLAKHRKNPSFKKSVKRSVKRRSLIRAERRAGKRRREAPPNWRTARGREQGHWRRNPGVDWVETAKLLGVGFAGFAGGRLLTRIVAVQVAKRKPTWAKHVGVASSLAAFLAAVFLAKRWKHTKPYEVPLQFGTGIALAQTIVQTYLPKLGWMVSDATADQIAEASGQQLVAPQSQGLLPPDDGDDDDEDGYYSSNDQYDHGRYAKRTQAQHAPHPTPKPQPTPATQDAPDSGGDDVDDLMAELDDDEGGGVFAHN